MWSPAWRKHPYSLVEGSVEAKGSEQTGWSSYFSIRALVCLILVGTLAFVSGRYSGSKGFKGIPELSDTVQVFRYNRTFGELPSNYSNQAWHDLFPEQGGFFKHPTIAPQRSAFAVFHQLHCLNSIREGYWSVYQAATEGRRIVDDDLPIMSTPSHIRHCIDLLRNTLMCQPDTTVELKNKTLGGVTGFGTEHQCKDWNQLVRWTKKWQAYEQDPREPGHVEYDHAVHNHPGHGH